MVFNIRFNLSISNTETVLTCYVIVMRTFFMFFSASAVGVTMFAAFVRFRSTFSVIFSLHSNIIKESLKLVAINSIIRSSTICRSVNCRNLWRLIIVLVPSSIIIIIKELSMLRKAVRQSTFSFCYSLAKLFQSRSNLQTKIRLTLSAYIWDAWGCWLHQKQTGTIKSRSSSKCILWIRSNGWVLAFGQPCINSYDGQAT